MISSSLLLPTLRLCSPQQGLSRVQSWPACTPSSMRCIPALQLEQTRPLGPEPVGAGRSVHSTSALQGELCV